MSQKRKAALADVVIHNMNFDTDAAEIVAIVNHNFGTHLRPLDFPRIFPENVRGIVAKHQGSPIGCFFYAKQGSALNIALFTVTEFCQEHGVEEMLTRYLMEQSERHSIRTITAYIHEDEEGVIESLREQKFEPIGTAEQSLEGVRYNATILKYDVWAPQNRLKEFLKEIPFDL